MQEVEQKTAYVGPTLHDFIRQRNKTPSLDWILNLVITYTDNSQVHVITTADRVTHSITVPTADITSSSQPHFQLTLFFRLLYITDLVAPVVFLITPQTVHSHMLFTKPFLSRDRLFLVKNLLPSTGRRYIACFAAVA
jgi:hypothetical protein